MRMRRVRSLGAREGRRTPDRLLLTLVLLVLLSNDMFLGRSRCGGCVVNTKEVLRLHDMLHHLMMSHHFLNLVDF